MSHDNVFALKNPAVPNEVRDALTEVLREGARTLRPAMSPPVEASPCIMEPYEAAPTTGRVSGVIPNWPGRHDANAMHGAVAPQR